MEGAGDGLYVSTPAMTSYLLIWRAVEQRSERRADEEAEEADEPCNHREFAFTNSSSEHLLSLCLPQREKGNKYQAGDTLSMRICGMHNG